MTESVIQGMPIWMECVFFGCAVFMLVILAYLEGKRNGCMAERRKSIPKPVKRTQFTTNQVAAAPVCNIDPREGESREDFVARCMSELVDEFPEQSQRFAACSSMFETNAGHLVDEDDDEDDEDENASHLPEDRRRRRRRRRTSNLGVTGDCECGSTGVCTCPSKTGINANVAGVTTQEDEHIHEYMVDEHGNGTTSPGAINGHVHEIVNWMVLDSDGHRHGFASMMGLMRTPATVENLIRSNTQLDFAINNVRNDIFEGRPHVVVPVVLAVEGVMNGLLYPAEEIEASTPAWNGVPIPVLHPTDTQGNFITANDPKVLEQRSIGRIFNATFEAATNDRPARLVADAWIDVQRAQDKAPDVLAAIHAHEIVEVSTGLWTDHVGSSGTFNGDSSQAIAVNFRPDHLAVLPGEVGACSVEDGCGLGANETTNKEKPKVKGNKKENLWERFKGMFTGNQAGLRDIFSQLQRLLDAMDSPSAGIHFLEEVFQDGTFIFRRESTSGTSHTTQLFRQSFQATEGSVEIVGEPVEVRKEVTFVAISPDINENQPGDGDPAPEGEDNMDANAKKAARAAGFCIVGEQCNGVTVNGERLAALLNREIDKMTNDSTTKASVIARVASAAGISSSTVNQILGASINCPPLNRLTGFARVLPVSMATIRRAAEGDGCSYGDS